MKERPRPIVLHDHEVRAILDDGRVQIRRVVKPQPKYEGFRWAFEVNKNTNLVGLCSSSLVAHMNRRCPYGQPGDVRWVKEKWRVGAWDEKEKSIAVDYKADNYARREWLTAFPDDDTGERFNDLWEQSLRDAYDAAAKVEDGRYKWNPGCSPCRWRPSIHIPRWGSRLTLRVTDVHVERLQDSSQEASEWDSINAKRGLSWKSNPWVWVVSLEREEGKT